MQAKQLDLLFGTPEFLADYRGRYNTNWSPKIEMYAREYMPYLKGNTHGPLVEAIKKLHKVAGNIDIADTDEIVIGVGATQMIFATLDTLYQDKIHIEKPYWFRFEKITKMAGLEMEDHAPELLVLPNNPTNTVRWPTPTNVPAIDACYLWPFYFRNPSEYETAVKVQKAVNPVVTIFSLAKYSGNAASRVGWAIVKDKEVAKQMRSYIEYASGGTSIEAQVRAAGIIESDVKNYDFYTQKVQQMLDDRWKLLDALELNHITVVNQMSGGMFAWMHCTKPGFYDKLKDKSILFLEGTKCGSYYGTARFNMGADMDIIKEFVIRLKEIDEEF